MMGEWEKFFTLHCYLLHQRNSSFPGKMQSRKINRLEAEEDLVEVVYRVCDGKKYSTQIFLKLCLGIAVFFFIISFSPFPLETRVWLMKRDRKFFFFHSGNLFRDLRCPHIRSSMQGYQCWKGYSLCFEYKHLGRWREPLYW